MRLYFAHNFLQRKEFRQLELSLEKELGIELFNPFYDDLSREEEMKALDSGDTGWENKLGGGSEMIVKRDLKNLASCDGLFTYVENPSFGTTIEMCNAVLMRKKTIIVVSKKYYNHPWVIEYATKTFEDIQEFKNYIKKEKKNERI